MLRIHIAQAKSGMRLAVPVHHPSGTGVMLLKDGFELDFTTILRLREMGVREVWITYPNTELLRQYVSPVIHRQQARTLDAVVSLFGHFHEDAHARLEYDRYRRTLRGLIESLVAEPMAASYIIETAGANADEMRHAAEVCFISVLLGLKLEGYLVEQRKRLKPHHARDVVSLGLGAMLHDLGMTQLPPEARERYERTRDERDEQWREHVTLGHRMVTGSLDPSAAGCLLHHHQYFDGSGFPTRSLADGSQRGLKGFEIHVFPRIVCVAEHYDRIRYRADGSVWPRVRVLNEMLNGGVRIRFDPVVLMALLQVVPAYPPGSLVTLSDCRQAVIVDWHHLTPCRPLVQIVKTDSDGTIRQPDFNRPLERIDLREQDKLHIAIQDGDPVAEFNFNITRPTNWRNQHAA